ncbi:MAG TPA: hypothetical protein VGS27_34045 [Candidatus Sulfotelmatobacter sp.]|nr:hypothetical protein [Candidatus Sulfotelmatobacter sp.]
MTSRVSYAPQDVQKMCKQAERDLEAKKLVLLMERVKRQIAAREHRGSQSKPAVTAMGADSRAMKVPSRSLPLER